jgi:hypothetical protein
MVFGDSGVWYGPDAQDAPATMDRAANPNAPAPVARPSHGAVIGS